MSRLLAIALSVFFSLAAFAQHHAHPFKLSGQKFPLLPNMGNLKHPITTSNEDAKKYFNQGLTLIYGFNYTGAYASFQEAFNLDDHLAIAHWGMALALGANINIDINAERMVRAWNHIQQARELSQYAQQPEIDYIEALAPRYSAKPETADKLRLAIDYQRAMRKLAEKYPPKVDPDASTLWAESLMDLRPWRLWSIDGKPYIGTPLIVEILEGVLKEHPDHVGAVHYHLHALEPSPDWKKAIGDALKLQTLVPGSGHLVHMPSHIFFLQGDYAKAAAMNDEAIRVDQTYRQLVGDDGYVGHYLSHNMHFLAVARTMENKFPEAIKAAREAAANASAHWAEEKGLEHYLTTPTLVLAGFGRWAELKKEPEPAAERKLAHTMWMWGIAMSLAEEKQLDVSRAAQAQFKKEAAACAAYLSWGNNPTNSLLNIADLVLSAKIAKAEDDPEAVSRILLIAQDARAELLYDEPPPWFIPLDL